MLGHATWLRGWDPAMKATAHSTSAPPLPHPVLPLPCPPKYIAVGDRIISGRHVRQVLLVLGWSAYWCRPNTSGKPLQLLTVSLTTLLRHWNQLWRPAASTTPNSVVVSPQIFLNLLSSTSVQRWAYRCGALLPWGTYGRRQLFSSEQYNNCVFLASLVIWDNWLTWLPHTWPSCVKQYDEMAIIVAEKPWACLPEIDIGV